MLIAALTLLGTVPRMATKKPHASTITINMSEFLTLRQFAELLGISYKTASVWNNRGWPDFPRKVRLPSGEIRIRPGDLEAWLRRRTE